MCSPRDLRWPEDARRTGEHAYIHHIASSRRSGVLLCCQCRQFTGEKHLYRLNTEFKAARSIRLLRSSRQSGGGDLHLDRMILIWPVGRRRIEGQRVEGICIRNATRNLARDVVASR